MELLEVHLDFGAVSFVCPMAKADLISNPRQWILEESDSSTVNYGTVQHMFSLSVYCRLLL
jgi:hypothetical protein